MDMGGAKSSAKARNRRRRGVIGILIGISIVLMAQLISGSGDFTFTQSASTSTQNQDSVIALKGERSADLVLPKNYSQEVSVPLLINLHGYSGIGSIHSAYTHLQDSAFNKGLAYIAPDGTEDNLKNNFWNASTACCDFNKLGVDDVAYIDSLIEKASSAANIDSKRIYLFGHSNGHFMSYAYLCSGSKKVAAIAGLAGAMDLDTSRCTASPSNVLHIHGHQDETILYGGGALFGNQYTSVSQTIDLWKKINSCSTEKITKAELLTSIPGDDVDASAFTCAEGSLELWSIPEGSHTPSLDIAFADRVIEWLLQRTLSIQR